MRLTVRDNEHVILVNGKTLMSSRTHGSEEALATAACRHVRTLEEPHVLVGGLGMGFTLRATLDLLPPGATVTVAELVPAVVEWVRGPLAAVAGDPLADPRVRIEMADVGLVLRARPDRFDAILLDVDNGPAASTTAGNRGLYDNTGVAAAYAALRVCGTLAVWSAWNDRKFEQRLRRTGRPGAGAPQEGRRCAHDLFGYQAGALRIVPAALSRAPRLRARRGPGRRPRSNRSTRSVRRRVPPAPRSAGVSASARTSGRRRYRRRPRLGLVRQLLTFVFSEQRDGSCSSSRRESDAARGVPSPAAHR